MKSPLVPPVCWPAMRILFALRTATMTLADRSPLEDGVALPERNLSPMSLYAFLAPFLDVPLSLGVWPSIWYGVWNAQGQT